MDNRACVLRPTLHPQGSGSAASICHQLMPPLSLSGIPHAKPGGLLQGAIVQHLPRDLDEGPESIHTHLMDPIMLER